MKKIFLYILLFLGFFLNAQNNTISIESMRVNRSASLLLTTSWQTIDFTGTSTYNENTFGTNPANGNKMVWWDSVNKLFKVQGNYDRQLNFQMFPETTSSGIGVTTVPTTVQYRIVVPNGISPGVDLILPYVDATTPFGDLNYIHLLAGVRHFPVNININARTLIRTNGFYVQMRLSNAMVLGTCSVTTCAVVIQALK